MNFPYQYGIIIVIPNYIIEWAEENLNLGCRDDVVSYLIKKYGGVTEPSECHWVEEQDFSRNVTLVRLWSFEKMSGLESIHFLERLYIGIWT